MKKKIGLTIQHAYKGLLKTVTLLRADPVESEPKNFFSNISSFLNLSNFAELVQFFHVFVYYFIFNWIEKYIMHKINLS